MPYYKVVQKIQHDEVHYVYAENKSGAEALSAEREPAEILNNDSWEDTEVEEISEEEYRRGYLE